MLGDFIVILTILLGFIGYQISRAYKAMKERNRYLENKERQNAAIEEAKKLVESKSIEELVRDSNLRYPSDSPKSGTDDHS